MLETLEKYKERILFLCRDWEIIPTNEEIEELYPWYKALYTPRR